MIRILRAALIDDILKAADRLMSLLAEVELSDNVSQYIRTENKVSLILNHR